MIFRVIDTEDLRSFFNVISAENAVVGPVLAGWDKKGKALFAFRQTADYNELRLDYTTTKISPKRYFLPYREEMASFKIAGSDWQKTIDYNRDRPIVLFGLHACDINALNRLDKVLLGPTYPMPYYAAKRRNTFIVGMSCMPQSYCFCRSMGTHTALHGFDLFITDIGGRYFVEVLSAAAYNLLQHVPTRPPEEKDHQDYMNAARERNEKFKVEVDTTDLAKILDMEFQSPLWKHWGDKCLGCGACANVCPTCYCYGIEETVGIDLKTAKKTKLLYSCNLVDFAAVAGGHNFRPERETRIKYRYYHKHRGFVEAFEESLCVGCGRCGESCLAGITAPEVIASIRERSPE